MCFNKCKCIGFLIEVFNVGRRKFGGKQLILLTNKFRQVGLMKVNPELSYIVFGSLLLLQNL